MSKIEVNQIGPQCGTTLTVGCGAGQTVNIDANTVTLGRCGATVSLAAGATQSGFGRTGTVDWDTTAKTASFTAVSGNGYFVNTTSGAITVTLPAGSAGDIISLADYAGTWQTNNVTVTPNGTDKIGGANNNATLSTEGQSVTFIYTDSTQGWLNTMDSTSNVRGESFIVATGGTITCCGDYKIHTFTGPGTFCVSSLSNNPANNNLDYLVIAGGGAGGQDNGGGGGAGGVRFSDGTFDNSPAPSNPRGCTSSLTVSVGAFPITVGSGGAAGTCAARGNNSIFAGPSTITSTGGGGGAKCGAGNPNSPGGSGGGAGQNPSSQGSGNTPPVSPSQGSDGGPVGPSPTGGGSGGGGFMAAGLISPPTRGGGAGGDGGGFISTAFGPSGVPCGSFKYYGGGGGGGTGEPIGGGPGAGGLGGGGPGGGNVSPLGEVGTPGTANTGGGGGGGGAGGGQPGGNGGSGIVIIRYKYQ